jgi:hypothetical protein
MPIHLNCTFIAQTLHSLILQDCVLKSIGTFLLHFMTKMEIGIQGNTVPGYEPAVLK